MRKNTDLRVYLVLDIKVCGGLRQALKIAELALQNGVTLLQLRCKDGLWDKRSWYEGAMYVKRLCKDHDVPLIINDELDIMLAIDADGIHVGQSDLPVKVIRRLIGEDKIIGLSTHNIEQVKAVPEEVDYIGMGPVYPTTSKRNPDPVIGPHLLKEMARLKNLPGVAIGGITPKNTHEVMACGVEGVAVIGAICGQEDVAYATRQLHDVVMQSLD